VKITNLSAVGPVLLPSDLGLAVLAAIQANNVDVQVQDRGAYVRVLAGSRCVVTRSGIEAALGRSVKLPSDLELCMTSFKGILHVDAERAVWEASPR
jgi:toluene monooxygenase system protein D